MIAITWLENKWNFDIITKLHFRYKYIFITVLLISLFISAFFVCYIRFWERSLNYRVQMLSKESNELQVERSQLLVEQSTWSSQGRIEVLAKIQHTMKVPEQNEIILVKL